MASSIAAINKKQTTFLLSAITTYINTNLFTSIFYFYFFGHGESCHVAVACKYRPKQVWMWTTSCVNGSKLTG